MAKFTDATKAALKALFETGDTPDGADFSDWFDRIQEAVQEHEHKATGGAASGTGDAGEIDHIKLPNEPADDNTGKGTITPATVDANATGIAAALHLAADGHYEEADASGTTTAPCTALALETGTGAKTVLLTGIMRHDAWNWTTGPGGAGLIYLSATTGALTQTAPTAIGDIVQIVGYAITDDTIYFHPQLAKIVQFILYRVLNKDTSHTTGAHGGEIQLPVGFKVLAAWAKADTAGVTGTTTVDIHDDGVTIMAATKISIETGEKSSLDATTQPVISAAGVAAASVITYEIDVIASGTAGKGLIIGMKCIF